IAIAAAVFVARIGPGAGLALGLPAAQAGILETLKAKLLEKVERVEKFVGDGLSVIKKGCEKVTQAVSQRLLIWTWLLEPLHQQISPGWPKSIIGVVKDCTAQILEGMV